MSPSPFLFFRKSKLLADQYQLLVDQRQEDIERMRRTLEEKSAVVERVERTNQDEVGLFRDVLIDWKDVLGSYCQ